MSAKLYGVAFSHPSEAARAMLELKGMDYELTNLPVGTQPVALRALGFRARTVPALKIDGRRLQGSKNISRALEELQPEPPLFPADRRAAVEEAEAWAERELQPLPRRFFRWALSTQPDLRRRMIASTTPLPAPGVASLLSAPMWHWFARVSRATDAGVREGVARLPELLDRVDALIADGTIGRPGQPNAADFQIASTIAVLLPFSDLRAVVDGRPGAELARRLFPRAIPALPPFMPQDWLAPL